MYRIGQSSDIHPLVENRKLILGGIEIPHYKGCAGHSDGDALLHAIGEAILGALALRDLGSHFSDQDKKFKDIASTKLLIQIVELMDQKGYQIQNIDSLVIIEKPKLAAYIQQMRNHVANILKTSVDNVNIKATRGEKLGYIGKEEGIMAQAVVLLRKKEENEKN